MKGKTKRILVVVVKWRHHANSLFMQSLSSTAKSVYGRLAYVLFANFWSRFAYVLSQFPNCFRLMSGWKNGLYTCVSHFFCIIAERTKSIHAQRSFRFFKTLAKRLVGETTVYPKIEQAKEMLCWQGALSNDTSYLELSLTFETVDETRTNCVDSTEDNSPSRTVHYSDMVDKEVLTFMRVAPKFDHSSKSLE